MQLVNEWGGEGGEMEDEGHLKAFSHHHKLGNLFKGPDFQLKYKWYSPASI